jgi:DNA modification methylase
MAGGGTTLIEAKLLNRKSIGIDINPKSIELIKNSLKFKCDTKFEPEIRVGDVRNLKDIGDNSIDLIVTHPPYLNIIKYSEGKIEGDLSNISSLTKFCDELELGVKEIYRVLKENTYCAILIGDTRRAKHYVPLSYYVMEKFLKNNFVLKEDIIKAQHNCQSTPYWKGQATKLNIYLIAHEHLYIFRKPCERENLTKLKYSRKINSKKD